LVSKSSLTGLTKYALVSLKTEKKTSALETQKNRLTGAFVSLKTAMDALKQASPG
jgi:hypothetical protein